MVYSEEVTTHRGAIGRHVAWDRPQSYYKTNGGLGQGLGLALGVKLAKPDQPVVALMGDGGFLYNPVTQCFGVAGEANLPFLTVLFNNRSYEAMRGNHLAYYPDGVAARSDIWHGVHIPGPDYAKLVEPFGGYGERVEDPAQLAQCSAQRPGRGQRRTHRANRRRPEQVTGNATVRRRTAPCDSLYPYLAGGVAYGCK